MIIPQSKELSLREVTHLRPPGESGRGHWSPELSVAPVPPCARGPLHYVTKAALRDLRSPGTHPHSHRPEGTIKLLQVPVYILAWVISSAYDLQVLSHGVSGEKCKWNIHQEGIASPVSPVATEPKVFHLFPGAQWCNGNLQKGHQEASKERSLQAAPSIARLCHQGDVPCLCSMVELPESPQHQGSQGLAGLGSGGQFPGQAKN